MLGEWALDLRRTTPVRRGGGFVGILILLAILGFAAAGWNGFWGPMRAQWGDHDDNFFNFFGLPEHDLDQQVLNVQIPANAAIEIQNPRGDVSVTAGDGNNMQVQAHEVAFANSDDAAKKIFDAEAGACDGQRQHRAGEVGEQQSGRLNLAITVPKTAQVTVNSGHGDVTAAGLGAGRQHHGKPWRRASEHDSRIGAGAFLQ